MKTGVAFGVAFKARSLRSGGRKAFCWALFPCAAALTACQGSHDLGKTGCLPLRIPAQVVLVQEAGLYKRRDDAVLLLAAHPREAVNDGFNGLQLLRTLSPGTSVNIGTLKQAWGFDVGKGRISAFGTVGGGEAFEYGWGAGTVIGRAPWEPASIPNLRTVSCEG